VCDIAANGRALDRMRKVDTREINYNGMAADYDARRFEGAENAYRERIHNQAMLHAIGITRLRPSILDVGAGTCRGLQAIQRAGFHRLRGLELSPEMIARGRWKLAPPVPIDRGSAFQLPYRDASFDVVVSWNFLHMFRLDLQQELVGEMTRVCRPGGLVVVELESLHKGLFVTRMAEQRRRRDTTRFTAVWDVRKLFPRDRYRRVRVRGAVFPKLYKVLYRAPRLGVAIERVAFVTPFNWLAARVVVSGQKAF
jgi:ubiquinone/menaquinone biosynthesis C-methylase UbiE